MRTPPDTERDPVTDERHGEPIVDPYRWLEADDEAVAEWGADQNAYTDEILDAERRESLRPRLERLAERATYHLPKSRGGRYVQLIEAPDADQPRLTVREGRDDEPRTLVDPAELGAEVSVNWFVPSPGGDRLVYGLMEGGTEEYDLRVLDVESGEVIDRLDDVGRCNEFAVAWAGGGSGGEAGTDGGGAGGGDGAGEKDADGFYYLSTGSADDGALLEKELRYRELGGEDRFVTDGIPPERWPGVRVDRESGLVLVALGELGSNANLYALDDDELVPVVVDVDATFRPLIHEGRVYLLTDHEAPRYRLLGIDAGDFADADGPDDFETVVPEGEDVLLDVAPAGDGFALHRIREAASVVTVHDGHGAKRHELSLPDHVGIARDGFDGSPDDAELFFSIGGFDRPTGIAYADVGPGAGPNDWAVRQEPELPAALDPRGDLELTVERIRVDSTDGATVPVYVVHRADLEPDGGAPTVLTGYGGFRIPRLPGFAPYALPFLADGGVYALACLRGGLEFGEEWHEAGSREHKHHVFEDFEAAAAALIDRGYTNADRLAGWGGSNGGLLVGAALTRRPDLFGAIVCAVPLLDMLRFHEFLLGRTWTPEYGSPDDPEAFAWLREYSPYHNVAERDYPATLFWTSAGDTRVHPAHARKMAALVQAETIGDAPICFRSYDETGHGVGTPTWLEVDQQVDQWTFVYEALDVEPS